MADCEFEPFEQRVRITPAIPAEVTAYLQPVNILAERRASRAFVYHEALREHVQRIALHEVIPVLGISNPWLQRQGAY